MAVYKENGKYFIKGKIKKDDGTYYNYKRSLDVKSKREATDFETDFIRKYQDIQLSKKYLTFKGLCEEFISNDKNIKEASRRCKKDVLDKACETIGDKKINLITKDILQKYINGLEKKYSQGYVFRIYYAMGNAFNYAVDQGYLQVSPLTRVHCTVNRDKVKKEMLFWEPDQFETFMRYVNDIDDRDFFIFMYHMGLRRGEAFALQWKDINFIENTVSIYKSVTNKIKGEAWAITTPKTKNSNRNISMPAVVKKTLRERLNRHKEIYGYNEECFVFGFYRPLSPTTVARKLSRYIKKANDDGSNLPKIRLHDLRHSHASYLINNMSDKFTDFDIAKRLGDTVQTLHDTYAHWFKQADKAIIEVMDKDSKNSESRSEQLKTGKYDELKELKELLDMDIITQEEFQIKKKEILGL